MEAVHEIENDCTLMSNNHSDFDSDEYEEKEIVVQKVSLISNVTHG